MNQQLLSRLTSSIDSTVEKYNYYLARYLNDYTIDIRATNDFTVMDSYGFNVPQDPDLSRPPSTNVIKSCVDTCVNDFYKPYCTIIHYKWWNTIIKKDYQPRPEIY